MRMTLYKSSVEEHGHEQNNMLRTWDMNEQQFINSKKKKKKNTLGLSYQTRVRV